jgi:CRISPR-associated RAMP protein (TIGR02581 family)
LNTLELKFDIHPVGPILIKSGMTDGADPTLPDMNFVRGTHPETGETTIYLPGSSLKGVIRSHAERIIRTVRVECCDPLSSTAACDQKPVFKNRHQPPNGVDTYQNLCPACRVFGHTVMASRFFMPDAYPVKAVDALPTRQMVAIDRRSGGSVNTFTMEVAADTREHVFRGRLLIRNFERWQAGLVGMVLRDINLGRIGIGFGKSRGLGEVSLKYTGLTLVYPGVQEADAAPYQTHIFGTGEIRQMTGDAALQGYDFAATDADLPPDFTTGLEIVPGWGGQTELRLSDAEHIENVFRALTASWRSFAGSRAS